MMDVVEQDEIQTYEHEETQELEMNVLTSPALARLIQEVRNEEAAVPTAYNRMHNRHNRSR